MPRPLTTAAAIAAALWALPTRADDCPGFLGARAIHAVGGIPVRTQLADLDNDGDLDAVTTNVGDNTISVLLNCGSGIFNEATHYATGPQVQGLAIGDINGDGFADVIVASADTSQDIVVFFNNGDGTLSLGSTTGVLDDLSGVAAEDVDGDGDIDVVASNRGGSLDIYRNGGAGTFTSQTNLNVGGGQIEDVLIADFNNDSRNDLACIDITNNTIILRIQNNFGGFPQSVVIGVGNTPSRLHAGDIDGDGNADLVASQSGAGEISVFFNEGGLVFAPEEVIGVADGPEGIASADFNDDGEIDLAIANGLSAQIALLLNDGGRAFTAEYIDAGSAPGGLAAGDTTGDGVPELAITDGIANTLTVLSNRGGDIDQAMPLPGAWGSAAADIDNDGDLDVAVANDGTSSIAIYENDDGLRTPPISIDAAGATRDVALADIDNDGNIDLIATQPFMPPRLRVFRGNGDLTFQPSTLYTWGNQQGRYLAVEDFNGDGWLDIAATSLSGGDGLFLNDGTGGFIPGPSTIALTSSNGIDAADLDGDGDVDFARAAGLSNRLAVYLNDGNANFTLDDVYIIGLAPIEVVLADFNNDGDLDMAGTNSTSGGSSTITTWIGNGDGSFGPASVVYSGSNPFGLAAADIDADGNLDLIFTRVLDNDIGLLKGDGLGGFTPLMDQEVGVQPVAVIAADLTGSGTPDLVVSNLGGTTREFGSVSVLYNACVACPGDLADTSGFGPPDGMVDFGDFFGLSFLAGACGTGTTNPTCSGDLSDSSGFGPPDGMIDFGDFFALSFLAGPCP